MLSQDVIDAMVSDYIGCGFPISDLETNQISQLESNGYICLSECVPCSWGYRDLWSLTDLGKNFVAGICNERGLKVLGEELIAKFDNGKRIVFEWNWFYESYQVSVYGCNVVNQEILTSMPIDWKSDDLNQPVYEHFGKMLCLV
jgi:hypothetical protein